jgi:hypothetical protein
MVNNAKFAPLPSASVPIVTEDRTPTPSFYQFILAHSQLSNLGPLVAAPNDATAAAAGIPVGGVYQSSGALKIRLT